MAKPVKLTTPPIRDPHEMSHCLAVQSPFHEDVAPFFSDEGERLFAVDASIEENRLGTCQKIMLGSLDAAVHEAFRDDWDGEGSLKAKRDAVLFADQLIRGLPLEIRPAVVSISADGHVRFEWVFGQAGRLSIRLLKQGKLVFAWRRGKSHGFADLDREGFFSQVVPMVRQLSQKSAE